MTLFLPLSLLFFLCSLAIFPFFAINSACWETWASGLYQLVVHAIITEAKYFIKLTGILSLQFGRWKVQIQAVPSIQVLVRAA
jgi:hypothetical protein